MAKKKKKSIGLTKKQIARSKRAQRQERMIIIGMAIVALAVIAVLGFGFYQEYVVKPVSPVAIVNGAPIRLDYYQKMVRYRRYNIRSEIDRLIDKQAQLNPDDESTEFLSNYYQQSIQQAQTRLTTVGWDALDELIDNELVRQEAASRGLSVTPDELDQNIEVQFGYLRNPPTPTPTPVTATLPITITPTPTVPPVTKEQFQQSYENFLTMMQRIADFSEEDFRGIIEVGILYGKLQTVLAEEVPTTDEQVHARHILVETEEEAQKVLERLEAGEDFEALAEELSSDEITKEEGGDLDWLTRDQFMLPAEVIEAAFSLQPGEVVTAPVHTSRGYDIIKVEERQEDRPLEEATLRLRKSQALSEWLQKQQESADIERFWSGDKVPPEEPRPLP